MKTIITDTSIWIGAFIKKDKWHNSGELFLNWLSKQQNITVIIPIGVIYEVVAGVLNHKYGGYKKAKNVLDLFLNDERFEVYYNSEDTFKKIIKIFNQYKVFSLVDSTIVFLYINRKCVALYSTDSHYDYCSSFINRFEYPI